MTNYDTVFSNYGDLYREILSCIYPAKNSTGFSERNLSVNFSKAFEKTACESGQKAISWFEFQFGERNNLHADAIIINWTTSEMLIVESKRFSNPNKKMQEIGRDIDRIYNLIEELKECNSNNTNVRINISSIKHFYGVILADVWTETEYKEEILDSFDKECFLTSFKDSLSYHHDIKQVKYNHYSLNDIVGNYHLVSLWWEL
jgi:hypothetical protein